MLYELEQLKIPNAQHLFSRLEESQPMCASVLAGVYPGKIYVDNIDHPKSALLTTFIEDPSRGMWGFLVGNPDNDNFNRSLNAAIFKRSILPSESPVLLLTCDPGDWGGQMSIVMAPRPPIWMPRWQFISRRVHYDWESALPEGFSVQPMNETLLKQPGLEIPDDVRTTIEKWISITHSKFQDYGFVTMDETGHKPIIAGWATVDFIAKSAGDLGFFTQPDYRRKGLGTVAAAAALEYGFELGLTHISWTCDANNQGSIRTAGKLGLDRIEDYCMALLDMDEAEHFGNLGYFALQGKNYTQAVEAFDKALSLEPESPHYVYYEAAQACALVGKPHKALDYLAQAVNRGWSDDAHARECRAFTSLHEFPEWESLLNQMRKS